jgi:hypothetical protein
MAPSYFIKWHHFSALLQEWMHYGGTAQQPTCMMMLAKNVW